MKNFQKLSCKFIILVMSLGFIASESFIHSGQNTPQTKFDGSGNIAAVWQQNDGSGTFIKGTYGTTFPIAGVALVDPAAYAVGAPMLITSTNNSPTGVAAVAVYDAFDNNTSNGVVLISMATVNDGWITPPTLLSLNDGTEYPNSDFDVSVSANGMIINVTWSSFLPAASDYVLRNAVSTNGGTSFSLGSIP